MGHKPLRSRLARSLNAGILVMSSIESNGAVPSITEYAGRLHRDHADKIDILIYDYVENDHPQLYRMWEKRQRGYRAMGYQVDFDQQQLHIGS